jgi:O-6-methylguanine DNA methyltransferase
MSFKADVIRTVRIIPRGETMSYGEVAAEAGSPGAARAVGSIMKGNLDPSIPCHRVIKADGSLGEYNRGGPPFKQKLLRAENVDI